MAKKRKRSAPEKLSIDVIEARSIVLVDDFGNERAKISCSTRETGRGGFTVIQLFDDNGRARLELQVDPDGNPGIRLSTVNDATGLGLSVVDRHGNGLSIGDSEGRPCINLGVPHPESNIPRPGPAIDVIDEAANRAWSVFQGEYRLNGQERSSS